MTIDPDAVLHDDTLWKRVGFGLGVGRVALGVVFWRAPVVSVRVAGLDAVSAPSADWLARMTAGRDIAIGAGTAAAVLRSDTAPGERSAWFLAGAVADLGDTLSIGRGVREGRLARLAGLGASSGALVAALVGAAAAAREVVVARSMPRGSATYGTH
ncbi:hypothetical protein ACXR2U_23670 [Jatrophihabitans sp. YIM 134969]